MRAAAIFGLGCSAKNLKPFREAAGTRQVVWRIGAPSAKDHADIILLFGGDGTVHRHLSAFVKLGLPVLIVPVGSGNDFASALGLNRVGDALTAWRRFCSGQGNIRTIDLGVIAPLTEAGVSAAPSLHEPSLDSEPGTHYFCSIAGIGLDCEVARRANRLPRWLRGHGGYALSLASTVLRFAPFPVKILTQADTGEWSTRSHQPTILTAFANSPAYGGGMRIAPRAKMDDGQLDVCVIAGIDPFKLACMFPTVYFGRHIEIREVQYFQASRIRVETESPQDVYADGEYVSHTPVEIGVQPAVLKVLMP
jgi:diacylglycerol kinase (ATP)